VSHNCTQELIAYQQVQAGKVDPTNMKTVDDAIQKTLQSNKIKMK
jgi:hypothetical protein